MVKQRGFRIYAIAFVISVMLFFSGLYIGMQISSGYEKKFGDMLSESAIDIYLLSTAEKKDYEYCEIYKQVFRRVLRKVDEMGEQLNSDEDENRYFRIEFMAYRISEKIREICGGFDTIAFLYEKNNSSQSKEMGLELDTIKKEFGDEVLIFSFDSESETGISVMNANGIEKIPAVIINGNEIEYEKEKIRKRIKHKQAQK